MRIRGAHFSTVGWAVILVAAILAVAALARLTVFKGATSKASAAALGSLRLEPGDARHRGGSAGLGSETAAAISGADYSTCAVVHAGRVDCWGDGAYGQLGDGTQASALAPVQVSLGRPATSVSAGGSHACAVLTDRTVRCWGSNDHGELGNDSQTASATPVPVAGLRDVAAVATGVAHTCALLRTGTVDCWGANTNGQLGDDTTADSNRPVPVQTLQGVRAIAAGLAHTCALVADGTVDCWGANANGELGNGTRADSPLPFPVKQLAGKAVAIDTGDAHTCALLESGQVQCWGWNIEGQLGNGGGSDSATPVTVSGLGPAAAIAAGGSHTCALLRSGGVECWGANLYGQLGDGTTSDSASPVAVTGLQNGVASITAGLYHSCAILAGGSATCWGWNEQGQLGNRSTTSSSSPVGVARLGLAADGTGTVVVSPQSVSSSARRVNLAFTYTVAAGGIHDGSVAITVPPGWSAPSTNPDAPGFSSAAAGRTVVSGRTISVTGLTLPAGASVVIVYGRPSAGARPHTPGAATWRVREQSSSSGNLSLLAKSPVVHVLSPDGSGILATKTVSVPNGATGRSLAFEFAPAPGGVDGGTLTLAVPDGWSQPSTDSSAPGYVRASEGSVTVNGRLVSVGGISLAGADRLRIVYGDRSGGGPGAHAPSTAVGSEVWEAKVQSSPGGRLVALSGPPQVNVLAPNGSGNVYGFASTVANGATGVHLSFTFQPASGGVQNGAFTLDVPAGWSPPSTTGTDPGYVTASVPGVTVAGRTITVPLKDVTGSVQVTYGAGTGAKAPSTNVGPQEWTAKERSVPQTRPKPIAGQPTVTVLSSDGSGRLFRISGPVTGGSTGNTVVFGYQAAPGGLQDGTVQLTVPDGWSAPSTNGSDAGYVIATSGSVSVSGRTITLSHVSLTSGGILTIVFGSRSGGGPGAGAAKHPGPTLWPAAEASTAGGTPKRLR